MEFEGLIFLVVIISLNIMVVDDELLFLDFVFLDLVYILFDFYFY